MTGTAQTFGWWFWTCGAVVLLAGCAAVAGLDGTYSVGDTGTGGSGNATATGGSGNATSTGGSGNATSTGGSGNATSTGGHGAQAAGGSGGSVGECGLGYECVADPGGITMVRHFAGSCPSGWSTNVVLHDGDDTGCESCGSCNGPNGGSCDSIRVRRYWDRNCNTWKSGPTTVGDGQCRDVDTGSDFQAESYRVSVDVDSEGSCSPPSSSPNPLPTTSLCELSDTSAGTCSLGSCVPEVGSATPGGVCVRLSGDVSCPGDYPNGELVYESVSDTRSCGCQCGAPSGASCPHTLYIWDNGNCTGPAGSGDASSCMSADDGHDGYSVDVSFQPGSCPQASANHSGDAQFGDPVTICCASAP